MPEFSVNIMPAGSAGEIAEIASFAEDRGCSRCWIYDEGLVTRDVYVVLAAIAMKTHKMMIGPGITNAYVRHPGVTASAIASIDELSGGRAFLGLGSGGGLTLDPMRIERHKPLTMVREMVEVLRPLFRGETVTFSGEKLSLGSARMDYVSREIDIFLAGRGPRMLELGAQLSDGFYLSYIYKRHLSDVISSLRTMEETRGRELKIIYSTMLVTEEKELQDAKSQLSFRLVDSPQGIKDEIGLTPDDESKIKQALKKGGPKDAGEFVKDEWVKEFTIVGDSVACKEELSQLFKEHGINEYQMPIYELKNASEDIERAASLFA